MDYEKALEVSPRPSLTLSQAFTEFTGGTLPLRSLDKLLLTYDKFLVLKAILLMEGRTIDRPFPYLVGICKNLTREVKPPKPPKSNMVSELMAVRIAEHDRPDRPTLRSPFDARVTV